MEVQPEFEYIKSTNGIAFDFQVFNRQARTMDVQLSINSLLRKTVYEVAIEEQQKLQPNLRIILR